METSRPTSTRDLTEVLHFVYQRYAGEIPGALFDRYLWFYGELERLQHKWVYGKRSPRYVCWTTGGAEPISVGLSVLRRGRVELWHMGGGDNELLDMVSASQRKFRRRRHLVRLVDEDLAKRAAGRVGCEVHPGITKLYAKSAPDLKSRSVRLLNRNDEGLISQIKPRRWPGYVRFLECGYRFYGLLREGRLVSMCGMTRLTGSTSQVVGVETFRDEDKKKGHAKHVCAMAMRDAVAMDTTITWSTSTSNLASIQTAQALGFQPYYAELRLDIRSRR